MYGGDEVSTPSPPDRSQTQQQREVYVDDNLPSKPTSNQKKTKESPSSITVPTIITTEPSDSIISLDRSQNVSVSGDDIEAAFDSISDYKTSKAKPKDNDTSDSYFGLSTIKENLDTDENIFNPNSSKDQHDGGIDFDNYFNKIKQPIEEKKPKKTAPIFQPSKITLQPKEQKRSTLAQSDDIKTPSTSVSIKVDTTPTSSITLPAQKLTDDNKHDSTDEDVDEVLGTLEVTISGKYTHTYIHTHAHTCYFAVFYL
jgi:hypothetical protein